MKVGKKISKGNETKINLSFGRINMPLQTIRSRVNGTGDISGEDYNIDPEEAEEIQKQNQYKVQHPATHGGKWLKTHRRMELLNILLQICFSEELIVLKILLLNIVRY